MGAPYIVSNICRPTDLYEKWTPYIGLSVFIEFPVLTNFAFDADLSTGWTVYYRKSVQHLLK